MMRKAGFLLSVLLLAVMCVAGSFAEAVEAEIPADVYNDPDAYLAYRMALPPEAAYAAFAYENDPLENPAAMEDVIADPAAVFGFSPNPESARLGNYADALDWSDPAAVAEAREARQEYFDSMALIYRTIEEMLGETRTVEEIARAASQLRNELRLESYHDNPEGLALVKESNLATYGNENGPTADSLYEKYGSWQMVLEKALSTNPGMDACLGFYDEYFDYYEITAAENEPAATV